MNRLNKLFSKCPTMLPVVAIVIHELGYWELIGIVNRSKQILVLAILLTIIILIIGDYDRRIWRAPLIGLLTWELLGLLNYRRAEILLFIALFAITLVSIVMKFRMKIRIPKKVWIMLFLFFGVLFGLFFDRSDSIGRNFEYISLELERWFVVSIPFILFDVFFNKKYTWPRYLSFTSWLPTAAIFYPVARLSFSKEVMHQVFNASFWIIISLVFFVLVPLLHGTKWKNSNREVLVLGISMATIMISSMIKWYFLEDPLNLVSPVWIMITKYWFLLCFPLLILALYYRESGNKETSVTHATD